MLGRLLTAHLYQTDESFGYRANTVTTRQPSFIGSTRQQWTGQLILHDIPSGLTAGSRSNETPAVLSYQTH